MFSNKITRTFGKKLRIGRLGLPMWAIGLAVMGMAAVAGQAVGPVLAGSVNGSVGLTVAQTVVLAAAPTDLGADTVTLTTDTSATTIVSDDYAATRNDEGTAFTVAMETQVGQTTGFGIALDNLSGKDANFILELKAPAGIDIEVSDDAGVGNVAATAFARLDANHWLGVLTQAATNTSVDLKVVVEPKDDAAPSFYTIYGRIIQISG